jgi:ABC-type multidrug transport system ATPase subunit
MYDHFPRLSKITNRMAGYCSGGEQQMIAIARALMAAPKMLMLDEPSLGLAPLLVKEIFENIEASTRRLNTTILVVEQNAKIALKISDYAYIMESGKIVLEGPPKNSRTTRMSKSSTWASPRAADGNPLKRSSPISGANAGCNVQFWANSPDIGVALKVSGFGVRGSQVVMFRTL